MDIFRGVTFRNAAFVSTSTNKYFARRWVNQSRHDEDAAARGCQLHFADPRRIQDIENAHVMNMHLPTGTRMMFAGTMFTRTGRARGQDEVTLDAGYT